MTIFSKQKGLKHVLKNAIQFFWSLWNSTFLLAQHFRFIRVRWCSQRTLYLDLMQKCLTNTIYEDPPEDNWSGGKFNPQIRNHGFDWPSKAHTMIGNLRLANLRQVTEFVITHNIPGDMMEVGVWRGGACIFMRAILKAYGITDRIVWCADSFEGLPEPDLVSFPQDKGSDHHTYDSLKISLEQVKSNFEKYDLLDDQVKFLKGWFKDSLPHAPVEKLSILRLDADMYESTTQALVYLYHKLSPKGFLIVDDYGVLPPCADAIHDFRSHHNITDPIQNIDGVGVYWQKS